MLEDELKVISRSYKANNGFYPEISEDGEPKRSVFFAKAYLNQ